MLYSKIPSTSFLIQLRKKLHKVDLWLIVERWKLCVKLCMKLCSSKQNEEQFTPNSTWRHSTDLLLFTLSFSKFRVPLSHNLAMFHSPELSVLDRVYADAISPLCKSVLVHHPLHGTIALFVFHLRQTTAARKVNFTHYESIRYLTTRWHKNYVKQRGCRYDTIGSFKSMGI